MTETTDRLLIMAVLVGIASCGQSSDDPLDDLAALVANREAGSLSLIRDANPPEVAQDVIQVGLRPIQILARGDEFLVLNVTGNSLMALGIDGFAVLREYDLGDDCTPRMMAPTSDEALVITCSESNELLLVDPDLPDGSDAVQARMDMPTGDALMPFDPTEPGQARPSGVAVIGHRAFVTLANVHGGLSEAGPGLVLVVDVAAWTADRIIELPGVLPLFVHRPAGATDRLYVSSFAGAVHVLDNLEDVLISTVVLDPEPGKTWEDSAGTVWVANWSAGRLMRFDADSLEVLEPVGVCPEQDQTLDVATNGRGRVFATCFFSGSVGTFLVGEPESSLLNLPVEDGPEALLVVQK